MQKRKVAESGGVVVTPVTKKSSRRTESPTDTMKAPSEAAVSVPSFGTIAPLIVATATPRQRNISPDSEEASPSSFSFGLREYEKILATVKGGRVIASQNDLAKVIDNPEGLKSLCNLFKFEQGTVKFASLKCIHDALNMSSRKRKTVSDALIREDVAPACVGILGSGDDDQKSMAAFLLSSIAFQSPEQAATVAKIGAIPPLAAMLSSPSPQQHKAAACTLAELLHENPDGCRTLMSLDGVPKLINLLASTSDSVRKWSLNVLLKIAHTNTKEFSDAIIEGGAVPHMVAGLKSTDARIRETSAELVGQLAEGSESRAATLTQQKCIPPLLAIIGCHSSTPSGQTNGNSALNNPASIAPAIDEDLDLDVADAGIFAITQLLVHGGPAARSQAVDMGVVECFLRLAALEDPRVASAAAQELLHIVKCNSEFAALLIHSAGIAKLVSVLTQRLSNDDDDDGSGDEGEDGEDVEKKGREALVLTTLQLLQYLTTQDPQVGVLLISLGGVSALKPLLEQDASVAPASSNAARKLMLQLLPSVQASASLLHMKWTPPDLRQEVLAATAQVLCCHVASYRHKGDASVDSTPPCSDREQYRAAVDALQRLFAPRLQRVARSSHLSILFSQMNSKDACTRETSALALNTLINTCNLRQLGDGTVKEEPSESSSKLDFEKMKPLYGDDSTSDISISVMSKRDGKMINLKAHRSVLAAYDSAFFKSFTSNPSTPDVKIQGIDYDIFSTVLKFLYTGEVQLNHPRVNALLLASIRCDIKLLKQKCELYHAQQIRTGTFLEYLKLSKEINGSILREHCLRFAMQHLQEIAALDTFPHSPYRQEILQYIGDQIVTKLQGLSTAVLASNANA